MKRITILLFVIHSLLPAWGFAQDYFNKIIPFDFGNPTPIGLIEYQDIFLIPVIYFGVQSTLISTDLASYDYHHFANFDFSYCPITINNNAIYSLAKDGTQSKALKTAKLNETFDLDWENEIGTLGDFNFPTSSKAIDTRIYNSFLIEESGIKKIGINQTDTLGNTNWTRYYESNIGYSYPWTLWPTQDKQMLLSYTIRYENETRAYPRVMKIDEEGEELWKTELYEEIYGGASPIWLARLSDSSILQSYQVDRWGELEFLINEWHFLPTRIMWLDTQGNRIREKLITSPSGKEIQHHGIKAGQGDYFFAYGHYDESDDNMGIITKYSNEGDSLWAHRYEHPEYTGQGITHRVLDILELANGDLIGLGHLFPPGENSKIWLFRVNSEGCFGTGDCEVVVSAIDNLTDDKIAKLHIFPNPAAEYVHINLSNALIQELQVYDLNGKLIQRLEAAGHEVFVNVKLLLPGMYVLHAFDREGRLHLGKLVKQ